jgi:elongator complex protein 3
MDFSKINLNDYQILAREIVFQAIKNKPKNRNEFQKLRNKIIKARQGRIFHNLYFIKAYNDLVAEGEIDPNPEILQLIQKRSVRTMSGVAPVTVLTKPYPCPGKCVYCPTDTRMPKSYLPSQPAAQRGFRQRFDPYTQVYVRLKALKMTGHQISKIELRILGGTFGAYPHQYQTWFIKRCLQAMNEFPEKEKQKISHESNILKTQVIQSVYGQDQINTLMVKSMVKKSLTWASVMRTNEQAEARCIGINIETRPDFIIKKEINRLRYLGVTKVELGVQTLDDDIQRLTQRGHTIAEVRKATKLLKEAGFKISYHMMPNLPGSIPSKDKKMIRELFENPDFKPDYLKIYPCVVMPKAKLAQVYRQKKYKPYSDQVLKQILLDNLQVIPEWCRVDRLARDIPADDIEAGFTTSNMRQVLEEELRQKGTPVRDIRAREIQNELIIGKNIQLIIRKYDASQGKELFLSYEDIKKDKIVALLRLRFPAQPVLPVLKNAALVREVHVYGKQIAVGEKGIDQKQHVGWGRKLIFKAEELAKKEGFGRLAIIAGIGTREYYRKLGYQLKETYMIKELLKLHD